MAISISVQYNGGLLPHIILLTHDLPSGNPFKYHVVCMCVFLPIHSGHQVRWTYQPGSHRRKVTQDLSSTFLRCVP